MDFIIAKAKYKISGREIRVMPETAPARRRACTKCYRTMGMFKERRIERAQLGGCSRSVTM